MSSVEQEVRGWLGVAHSAGARGVEAAHNGKPASAAEEFRKAAHFARIAYEATHGDGSTSGTKRDTEAGR